MTIADYIKSDIAAHIRSGQQLPAKLTVVALSQHYGVSATPVRTALDDLVDGQILKKLDNGRLMVNPDHQFSDEAIPIPTPPTNWDTIITRDVLLQSVMGHTNYLREESVAAKYEIGRTKLRRIFAKLAGARILEHEPRRGWRIRSFNEREMNDYVDVRETLEIRSLELAKPFIDLDHIRQIRSGNTFATADQPAKLDNSLHRYWINGCNNVYIRDFFDLHGPYFNTLFDYAAPVASVTDDMVHQHHVILDAILIGQWDEAKQALISHIRGQQPVLAKMIERLRDNVPVDQAIAAEPFAV